MGPQTPVLVFEDIQAAHEIHSVLPIETPECCTLNGTKCAHVIVRGRFSVEPDHTVPRLDDRLYVAECSGYLLWIMCEVAIPPMLDPVTRANPQAAITVCKQ